MKVGDLVRLSPGTRWHFDLLTDIALLVEKVPRPDYLQYDWKVLADGKYIELGRQLEGNAEGISESR